MAELIYSLENIFSHNTESCLIHYDAHHYLIAAYQRGYKWASDEYGAVTILLQDLWNAFKKGKNEYYLQYITLKKVSSTSALEVIDGQQRLTTLSILLSVITLKLREENLADQRLDYAIRNNFFTDYIYNREKLEQLLLQTWEQVKELTFSDGEKLDSQDVFYLFEAAKKIDDFLKDDTDLSSFYKFLKANVKIIVNVVDHISSEKVFGNLNSNKVALTEVELIKGLLLTKFARAHTESERRHFREIIEQRMFLGRQWDEMARWCNQREVRSFFFDGEDGMDALLKLVAIKKGYEPKKDKPKDYALFNFYHSKCVRELYEALLETYAVLKDWFASDEVYNLLGYILCAKGSKKSIKDFLPGMNQHKSAFLDYLEGEAHKLIPKELGELFYGDDNDEIHKVLFALNVFKEGEHGRFNFYWYKEEKWTLEHIFPQTPEGKDQQLKEGDAEIIIEMLGEKVTDEIKQVLCKPIRTDDEKALYQEGLKELPILNSIGNICLLTNEDNISNGCGFFDEKRTNILRRIRKGSFVPPHTFDVFSKMVFAEKPGCFERWTNSDIERHAIIIQNAINSIKFRKQ